MFSLKRSNKLFEGLGLLAQRARGKPATGKKFVTERDYHDDFLIPGISPLLANSLKQILQRPKALINPCLLPHLKHLLIFLDGYFGFTFAFASCDTFAMVII